MRWKFLIRRRTSEWRMSLGSISQMLACKQACTSTLIWEFRIRIWSRDAKSALGLQNHPPLVPTPHLSELPSSTVAAVPVHGRLSFHLARRTSPSASLYNHHCRLYPRHRPSLATVTHHHAPTVVAIHCLAGPEAHTYLPSLFLIFFAGDSSCSSAASTLLQSAPFYPFRINLSESLQSNGTLVLYDC